MELIEEIRKLGVKGKTIKEIADRLNMRSPQEVAEVGETVKELAAYAELAYMGNGRYSAPQREKLIAGVLRGNRRGFAFLAREDRGDDLFIPHSRLNGALHGDRVFCRLVKGDEAEVVSVISRGITRLVGTYVTERGYGFVIPDNDSYYTDLFVPRRDSMNAPNNTKVVAEIVSFTDGKNPTAKITEVIGKTGERDSDVLSILKSYGFYDGYDAQAVGEAARLEREEVRVKDDRRDLRGMLTVTIDGDDSKDLDDAISLFRKGDKYELYVHIADVSHYVRTGSVLDTEALKRATSVYFPGAVYPMLPKELSNGICSLNEGEDRLALTVRMLIDRAGKVTESEIMKSVINNDRRMTYKDVTAILEGDGELAAKYADVTPMLEVMKEVSDILFGMRERRGYINFETKESKIELDDEGKVVDIQPYPYTMSNGIIEEFMLLTNETVAEFVCNMEVPFVYRVHEKPDADKVKAFGKFLEGCGIAFNAKELHPSIFKKVLEEVAGKPIEPIVSRVMLRSMKKARYTVDNLGHFGLASQYYCHFTSPIRRYPDLMIHRIIKMIIDGHTTDEKVRSLADRCVTVSEISSEREKAAETAERDIDDYYKAEFMNSHIGEEYEGTISGVTSFGVFVELDNTCEGLIRVENLPEDKYVYDEEAYTMRGYKHVYSLGQRARIRVTASDPSVKRISFEMAGEEK